MAANERELEEVNVLYSEIRSVLQNARNNAYQVINFSMVQAYWQIGYLIVEHEQRGEARAEYGKAVLSDLSSRLTNEFGKGFDSSNLRYMRQFYLKFSKCGAVRHKSLPDVKCDAMGHESVEIGYELRPELSWTHYRLLLRVENEKAREWYMHEAAEQHWSTRQLDRQISTLYYDRLLASRDKVAVRQEAREKLVQIQPEEFIRDPYVLEFLNLKDYPGLRENVLETAIIDNLQSFLLELGKGFSFVARQKRIRFEDTDFYVDLVFYNYILKCFVLIDLKIGALTHQDIGQMDSYVRMYEDKFKLEGDNPTVGLILCSEKNEAIAKYSVLNESKQLFASKYMMYLPSEEELERELKRERNILEDRKVIEK
nr:PDDEXK nuclease domain-containing protein [uncultured Methanolobus sp.]